MANQEDHSPMNDNLQLACQEYLHYLENILKPAYRDFRGFAEKDEVTLHRAFGANLFVAHAVDHLMAVRLAANIKETRGSLIKMFDLWFAVGGGRLRNRKMELIDLVNNSLKHVQVDETRYKALIAEYGPISYRCLSEESGRVLCILNGYRIDYSSVVLLPAFEALCSCYLGSVEDVLDFAASQEPVFSFDAPSFMLDDYDPIDRMIDMCNPCCIDCGEQDDSCLCARYVFDGKHGRFEPAHHTAEEFDEVFSQISGAYSRDG